MTLLKDIEDELGSVAKSAHEAITAVEAKVVEFFEHDCVISQDSIDSVVSQVKNALVAVSALNKILGMSNDYQDLISDIYSGLEKLQEVVKVITEAISGGNK